MPIVYNPFSSSYFAIFQCEKILAVICRVSQITCVLMVNRKMKVLLKVVVDSDPVQMPPQFTVSCNEYYLLPVSEYLRSVAARQKLST